MRGIFDTLLGTSEAFRGEDKLVIRVDMPGVNPDAIDISVENGVLSVHADRAAYEVEGLERVRSLIPAPGSYSFDFAVGHAVDADATSASYDAGVLTVTLPVSEKAKARKVAVVSDKK